MYVYMYMYTYICICEYIHIYIYVYTIYTSIPTVVPVPPTATEEAAVTVPTAKEGDSIPAVVFKARIRDDTIEGQNPFDWKDVSTDDLFKGKRAVVFSLPSMEWLRLVGSSKF